MCFDTVGHPQHATGYTGCPASGAAAPLGHTTDLPLLYRDRVEMFGPTDPVTAGVVCPARSLRASLSAVPRACFVQPHRRQLGRGLQPSLDKASRAALLGGLLPDFLDAVSLVALSLQAMCVSRNINHALPKPGKGCARAEF